MDWIDIIERLEQLTITSTYKIRCNHFSGSLSEQPILQPPTLPVCPNDTTVIYTCHDSNVTEMAWFVETFPRKMVAFLTGVVFRTNITMKDGLDSRFFGKVTNIVFNQNNTPIADNITTTLRVNITGLRNGTNITCKTFYSIVGFPSSSCLYIAGI